MTASGIDLTAWESDTLDRGKLRLGWDTFTISLMSVSGCEPVALIWDASARHLGLNIHAVLVGEPGASKGVHARI